MQLIAKRSLLVFVNVIHMSLNGSLIRLENVLTLLLINDDRSPIGP